MKLSEQTLSLLKNFASINPSIKFKAGSEIRTVSTGGEMVAKATIDAEFPQDFCVYDLSRFLQCATLIGTPELEFGDNTVTMIGENNAIHYGFTDPTLIDGANYSKVYPIETLVCEVEISQQKLQKIKQAASVLGVPNISLVGDGRSINLVAHDVKNKSADRYKVLVGTTDKKFTVNYKVLDFKMISDDYVLRVSDGIITEFTGNLATYVVAAEIIVD
jgi:gp45 sliding clamp, C terminal